MKEYKSREIQMYITLTSFSGYSGSLRHIARVPFFEQVGAFRGWQ